MMKYISFFSITIFFMLNIFSIEICYAQNTTKTGEGAIIGGVLGAVAGGAIGNKKHKTAEGALIGGALGALGGAVVGSQIKNQPAADSQSAKPVQVKSSTEKTTTDAKDHPAAQNVQAVSQATPSVSKVTIKQIVYWTDQGLPDEEIISRIKHAHATFILASEDIDYLKRKGVSQTVIGVMQEK